MFNLLLGQLKNKSFFQLEYFTDLSSEYQQFRLHDKCRFNCCKVVLHIIAYFKQLSSALKSENMKFNTQFNLSIVPNCSINRKQVLQAVACLGMGYIYF